MLQKVSVVFVFGIAVLVVGCGSRSKSPLAGNDQYPIADAGHVTLHVKDMAKLLKLGWRQWPNRVEEALSGLPGICSLDVDLERDLFQITYDKAQLTPDVMLETVQKQGLEGDVVPNDSPGEWRNARFIALRLGSDQIGTIDDQ